MERLVAVDGRVSRADRRQRDDARHQRMARRCLHAALCLRSIRHVALPVHSACYNARGLATTSYLCGQVQG
eukprot:730465-Rhodomonas_salina.2